jgi:hypothetical protein
MPVAAGFAISENVDAIARILVGEGQTTLPTQPLDSLEIALLTVWQGIKEFGTR